MSSDPGEALGRAEQLRAVGRAEQAVEVLRQALADTPGDAGLLLGLSTALIDAGDARGGEAAAREVLAVRPQSASAREALAVAMLRQNRLDHAAAVLSDLIAQLPTSANAWGLVALAGIGQRRADGQRKARAAYRHAIELDPHTARYRRYAAVVEHAYGDDVAARTHVLAGLELDPQSPRLLALHAEYAPVGQQPALLADVLAANPGDAESLEILDAAVTWEGRVAATPAVGPPAVVAALALTLPPAGTAVLVAGTVAAGVLMRRRLRGRLAVLPAGYLAGRTAQARIGTMAHRVLLVLCGAGLVAGAVVTWWSAAEGARLLALAALAGLGAALATLPDDVRVLARARRRTGRVWGGTAWRFGGLRQELVLWSALVIGVLTLVGVFGAAARQLPGGAVGAVALVGVATIALLLVESANAAVNAPQRYLRTLGNRYRVLAALGMAVALLVLSGSALASGARPFTVPTREPAEPSRIPGVVVPPVTIRPLPTFSVPAVGVPDGTLAPSSAG